MTNLNALSKASLINDEFYAACVPFVARVTKLNTADDNSFEVVIEMVRTDNNGFLSRRHIASLSAVSDSSYTASTMIIKTWNATRTFNENF